MSTVSDNESGNPSANAEPGYYATLRSIAEHLRARGDCGCSVVLADGVVASLRIDVPDPFAGRRAGR